MDHETSNVDKPLVETIDQTGSATSFKACIKSSIWWKNAGHMSVLYARQCLIPAGLWLASLSFFVFPCVFVIKTLNGTIDLGQLVLAAVVYLVAVFIALPTMFWSFGSWLIRLTAFCQAFSSFSAQEMIDSIWINDELWKRKKLPCKKQD